MTPHILYIHGFNSSPQSYKAQATQQYIETNQLNIHYTCPQLDVSPKKAVAQLEQIIADNPHQPWYFIGSSLGGYYASYLAQKYQRPAVLVNPAVKPYELLVDYIGEQKMYHSQETVIIEPYFMHELKVIEQNKLSPSLYWVMLQTGDEVLDYRQAEAKYQQCRCLIEQGGDHSFTLFDNKLPEIMRFFKLAN